MRFPWSRRRKDQSSELQEELDAHFALDVQQRIEAGCDLEEAKFAARRDFGNVMRVEEITREMWGWSSLELFGQDVRYASRRLRHSPTFTLTTMLTLALGIGATTAIFTLVYAVLLKSLAVANPNELLRLGKTARCCFYGGYSQDKEFSLVSYELYKYLRDNTDAFSKLAAFEAPSPDFGVRRTGHQDPAQSDPGEFVSGNYFEMFGVTAYSGRLLAPSDDRPGAPAVAVMSYRFWQERYGADPSIVGSTFDIDQKPFTIIGIAPAGFFGDSLRGNPPAFFLPLNTEPLIEADADLNRPGTAWLHLIGRMKPGEHASGVEAEMRVGLKQWLRSRWGDMSADDRAKFPQQTLFLRPGGAGISTMRDEYEHWLQILMVVSGFVLLIVCANIANLTLVRGVERRRQTSLSMALGAPAKRVVRQALTESILLSLLGGAAGLLLAFAGTSLILHFAFPTVAGMPGIPISASPSLAVFLFAFAVSLLTGIGFGVAPAWMATRVDPIEALRGSNRSTERTGSLPRQALVVFQYALSLALLSASGLLSVALYKLESQDFGFDQNRRNVAMANPRLAGYKPNELSQLYQRIEDRFSGMPSVAAVALCTYSPLSGNAWGSSVWIDGHPPPGPNDNNFALRDRATAGYFEAIGNPIERGRGIFQQDTATSAHVAVINEAFARKYFKNEDPIGRHFGRDGIGSGREYEIVGVAKDARYLTFDLEKPIPPLFVLPESQQDLDPKTGSPEVDSSHFLSDIIILSKPGVSLSEAAIREAIASVDANLPVIWVQSLKEQVSGQFRQQRLIARLTSFFGVLSLGLSCVGLYGVTAYNVGRRTAEIGVRMAMGANGADVMVLVLRGAFTLIFIGLVIGLPLTFVVGRLLGSQLYGTPPYNPFVTSIAIAVLGVCALFAALIPALKASSVSPVEALRAD
jgi:predicted permease